jgi:hypothetical protein
MTNETIASSEQTSKSEFNGGLEREMIKNALLHEASRWSYNYKLPVWKALRSAAKRMNIDLSEDECYRAMKRSKAKYMLLKLENRN